MAFAQTVPSSNGDGTTEAATIEQVLSSAHPPFFRRALDLADGVQEYVSGWLWHRDSGFIECAGPSCNENRGVVMEETDAIIRPC